MTTTKEIIALAKQLLTTHGRLEPSLLIEGTKASAVRPLPDAPEPIKLSLLEALGYTLATEQALGDVVQLWLMAEGWASRHPYQSGVPATQLQHAADRQEVVVVFCYQAGGQHKAMTIYETIRNGTGELIDLRSLTPSDKSGELVQSPPLEAFITGFARGRQSSGSVDQN